MPSLPPKCSYTTGLLTPARCAISSTEVTSKPFSANNARATSSSCSRRSLPVMRTRTTGAASGSSLRRLPVTPVTIGARRPGKTRAPRHGRRGEGTARSLLGDALEALPARPAHVRRPAELLEHPDQPRGDVDLAAPHAVAGAGRVGVVQVVPRLAERQDRQRPEVGGPVAGRE